ncbi:MAG: hypothetical protein MJH10_09620 [Epibacterium sp.]|nr:hypothetical protein [Epibacterium sp.]NQX73793.1 hypothetical protein [Epibacterium sp.]
MPMHYSKWNRHYKAMVSDDQRLEAYRMMTTERLVNLKNIAVILRYGIQHCVRQQLPRATAPSLVRVNLAIDIHEGIEPGKTTEEFFVEMMGESRDLQSDMKENAIKAIMEIAQRCDIDIDLAAIK